MQKVEPLSDMEWVEYRSDDLRSWYVAYGGYTVPFTGTRISPVLGALYATGFSLLLIKGSG